MFILIFNMLKFNTNLTYGEVLCTGIKQLGIFCKVSVGMSSNVGGNGEHSPDRVRANMINSLNSSTNHAGGSQQMKLQHNS